MSPTPPGATPVSTAPPSGTAVPRVVLQEVSVFYGEVVGLSKVSLSLEPGVTGIVGPNGSGKTTLMRSLTGLLAPAEGTVRVLGSDPFLDASVRARLTFVPASENFYEGLSGRQNLALAFLARGFDRKTAYRLADQALELIRLTADGGRRYGTWSRGMRQRLKLGVAMTTESDVVLLDEPFLGVDPPNRVHLRDHILELSAAGRTVLVSSHVLHEIEALTDRVGVLASGRLLGFGRVDAILREIRVQHPHRIALEVDDARGFGVSLLGRDFVREIRIENDRELEFVTDAPDVAYLELAKLVGETGVLIRRLTPLDDSLEAVFEHVTAAGTRRL